MATPVAGMNPVANDDEQPPTQDPLGATDSSADEEARVSVSGRTTVMVFDQDQLAPLFFSVLFLSTIGALLYVLAEFVGDLVMAFILVGLVRVPYEWIRIKLGNRPWIASAVVTMLVLAVIVLPIIGFGYTVATEAAQVYGTSSRLLAGGELVQKSVNELQKMGLSIPRQRLIEYTTTIVKAIEGTAVETGGAILSNILGMSLHLLTVLVMIFYVLVDGNRLRQFLFDLSPLPDHEDALLEETFRKVAKGVVVGQGLGSAIQGVLGGISFWLAGLPSPVLWGSVMAFFAFLPLVGVTAVALPAAGYLYISGHPGAAAGLLAFNVAQGTLIDNVVKTKMIGSAMRMHDLLVFLSVLGGIAGFGLIGLVYGPLIAMLFMTLSDLYNRVYRPKLARRFARS